MSPATRRVTIRRADRARRHGAAARSSGRHLAAPFLGLLSAGALASALAVVTAVSAVGVLLLGRAIMGRPHRRSVLSSQAQA